MRQLDKEVPGTISDSISDFQAVGWHTGAETGSVPTPTPEPNLE